MKIEVRGDNIQLPQHTRVSIENKCRLAFGRIVSAIGDVRIVFRDENGPRGGVDLRCSVDVRMRSGAEVRAEGVDALAHTAADLAMERAARSAHRTLARRHESGRNSIRFAVDEATY